MTTKLPAGNDFLSDMPGQPVREHWRDNTPESSPPTTPSPEVHVGANPDDAAKGAVN